MTIKEAQTTVDNWIKKYGVRYFNELTNMALLTEETGELARIIAEALTRWPESRVEVQHRLGEISAGEASIAVVAASPHRAEAFDVCRYVIEEIKVRLPIWKKEIFEDGSSAWRGNDSSRGPVATA